MKKIRRKPGQIEKRVSEVEGTLSIVITNIDEWMKKYSAEVLRIQEEMRDVIDRLDQISGGGE